jgi:MFS family permease
VAFAFLIVMAVATLPSPLYGLYRTRDDLSAFTITVVFAIFAGSTIAVLQRDSSLVARIGRRGMMLASVATMIVAVGVLAAWKDLPGLLIGRVVTGVSVGLAAGTAITYLVELRLRADPKASAVRARTIWHVGDHRRTWRRPTDLRLPGAVGGTAADRALPRAQAWSCSSFPYAFPPPIWRCS